MLCCRMHLIRQLQISNSEVKKRLQKTLLKYAIVFAIALAYLIFVLCTGIGIPCIFYEITGLKCVGCGISRMLVSIVKLDFAAAFSYNAFLFVTGPVICVYILCSEIQYIKHGNRRMGKLEWVMWIELVLALLYWIFRNILPI